MEILGELVWAMILPFLLGANTYLWTGNINAAVVFFIIGVYFERVLIRTR
jgi:hypothetical protein